jgi:hypothetical protein
MPIESKHVTDGSDVARTRKSRKAEQSPFRGELLDELMASYKGPDDLVGPDGLLKQLR